MSDDNLELKIFTNQERMLGLEQKLAIAVGKAEDGQQSVAASALFQSLPEICDLLADARTLYYAWHELDKLQDQSTPEPDQGALELEDDPEASDEDSCAV